MKIIYADFCHTIVRQYTLGKFVRYCLLSKRDFVGYIFFRLRLLSLDQIFSREIVSKVEVKRFGKNFAKKLLNLKKNKTLRFIKDYQNQGFKLVIVSAGLKEYIMPFFQMENIKVEKYLTSTLCENKFKFNYGDRKVEMIEEFEKSCMNINYRVGISDHISDVNYLNLCSEKIISVGPNKEILKYAKKSNNGWKIIMEDSRSGV